MMTWLELAAAWGTVFACTLVTLALAAACDKAERRHVMKRGLARRAEYHHWLYMNGYTDEKGFLRR
jgi:hypothetical protein